ncbi:DnaB-like helicase C-terminal domain-containing protein [Leptospira venezuelensis]|uniref:DnaB-like helicase C-terminal domain-containing protein n=1 Tax=Leptospira venezuelensis TaxID=1958811 RepID=UPI000A3B4B07|nr:DnaB-like helicase C-terminal domain-containing protein [Leptospira venezuelensis]
MSNRVPVDISDIQPRNLFEREYFQILEERTRMKTQRSLGFESLDKLIYSPAAMHELTILAGESGTGKSLFGLAMELELLKKGVCVVKIFPEMGKTRNHDRFISMLANIVTKDLNLELFEKPDRMNEIKYDLSRFTDLTNRYYPVDDRNVSVETLPLYIEKAKRYFEELGVLPSDEYMVVFIDLLSLLNNWGSTAPAIEDSLANLNRVIGTLPIHVVGIVQTNESKKRSRKDSEENNLENYYVNLYDIKNSAAYKERARDVLILNRPNVIASRFDLLYNEMLDFIDVSLQKSNDGETGNARFVLDNGNGIKIYPYRDPMLFDYDDFQVTRDY